MVIQINWSFRSNERSTKKKKKENKGMEEYCYSIEKMTEVRGIDRKSSR